MVDDLKMLRDVIRARIIDKVDHKNLNSDVAFLRGVNPTAENLAAAFWGELAAGGVEVHVVPGIEEDIFREPNVSSLARSLQACLDRAQGALP